MADTSRRPGFDSKDARAGRTDSRAVSEKYEQLTLGPTITGPRMHTEDLYEPGTRLKIKGERGVFTYRYASISRAGQVSLHLLGDHSFRAVRPR